MKKICFVISSPNSARSFLTEHTHKLSEKYEVYLVANYENSDELSGLLLTDHKAIQIERRPKIFADLKALYQLYRYFRKEKFHIVHSISRKAGLLTAIAGFAARIPHRIQIFTGQIWATMSGAKRWFYVTLDKFVAFMNTELLADGFSQRDYLIENGVVKEGQVQVLANGSICGVNTKQFSKSKAVRNAIREELSYGNNDIVFIYLGRLKGEKGTYELLEAFNKLSAEFKNTKLLLVGADEENCINSITNYSNLVLGSNVVFYGHTKTPERLLQAGDIYCFPSYREGFGLAVLEASSVGLPVICSDIYGLKDTMVNNVTGIRCKVKDADSLYQAMKRLYIDKNLREELGSNGQKRVVELFSTDVVTSSWIKFYDSLK